MDIEAFNAAWLDAWSEKDVPRLLTFYAPNIVYKDGQVPQGLNGHEQLGPYLKALFHATPPMRYVPDQVWAIEGGYCGRWNCALPQPDGSSRTLRGFDLVLMEGDQIALNEVYTHTLT